METCLGCSLVRGKLPIYKVYESENVIGLLDHQPFNDGHILVLPKSHRREFTELTVEEHLEIQQVIQLLSGAIHKLVKPDGISILQNGGNFNELGHVHFHLVPRYQHQNFSEFYEENGEEVIVDAHRLQVTQQNIVEAINAVGS